VKKEGKDLKMALTILSTNEDLKYAQTLLESFAWKDSFLHFHKGVSGIILRKESFKITGRRTHYKA